MLDQNGDLEADFGEGGLCRGPPVTRRPSNRRRSSKLKSIDDFSVTSYSPPPSPGSSPPSTPDIHKPRFVISDLVAQRFARLTKKVDEAEATERRASEDLASGKHIRRQGRGSVLGLAPSQLARVSIIEGEAKLMKRREERKRARNALIAETKRLEDANNLDATDKKTIGVSGTGRELQSKPKSYSPDIRSQVNDTADLDVDIPTDDLDNPTVLRLAQQLQASENHRKEVLINCAKLENERSTFMYRVEDLKDLLEDQTELAAELKITLKAKCRDIEKLRMQFSQKSKEVELLTCQVQQREELLKEKAGIIITQLGDIMEIPLDDVNLENGANEKYSIKKIEDIEKQNNQLQKEISALRDELVSRNSNHISSHSPDVSAPDYQDLVNVKRHLEKDIEVYKARLTVEERDKIKLQGQISVLESQVKRYKSQVQSSIMAHCFVAGISRGKKWCGTVKASDCKDGTVTYGDTSYPIIVLKRGTQKECDSLGEATDKEFADLEFEDDTDEQPTTSTMRRSHTDKDLFASDSDDETPSKRPLDSENDEQDNVMLTTPQDYKRKRLSNVSDTPLSKEILEQKRRILELEHAIAGKNTELEDTREEQTPTIVLDSENDDQENVMLTTPQAYKRKRLSNVNDAPLSKEQTPTTSLSQSSTLSQNSTLREKKRVDSPLTKEIRKFRNVLAIQNAEIRQLSALITNNQMTNKKDAVPIIPRCKTKEAILEFGQVIETWTTDERGSSVEYLSRLIGTSVHRGMRTLMKRIAEEDIYANFSFCGKKKKNQKPKLKLPSGIATLFIDVAEKKGYNSKEARDTIMNYLRQSGRKAVDPEGTAQ